MSRNGLRLGLLAVSFMSLLVSACRDSDNSPASGTLDRSFGESGIAATAIRLSDVAYAVAIQPDGKIIAAGSTNAGADDDFALVRYRTDGSLDTTFGGTGKVSTDILGNDDVVSSLVVQSDGKIIAGGYAYNGTDYDFALARYHADGSLDTTFGGDGIVITAIGTSNDFISWVGLQSDGKIVAAGSTTLPAKIAVARYLPDGSLDGTFGTGGVVATTNGLSASWANSGTIQQDGKIIVAGGSYDGLLELLVVARYDTNGTLDASFGGGGITAVNRSEHFTNAYSVIALAGGKIIAAGSSLVSSLEECVLMRFEADGSFDTTFGTNGLAITMFGAAAQHGYYAALQPDGKIVAAGFNFDGVRNEIALARYHADGSPDTCFGEDGVVTTGIEGASCGASAIAIQSDGDIVVAGYEFDNDDARSCIAVARYHP